MSMYEQPPPQRLIKIPNGKEGIKTTLRIMRQLVRRGRIEPHILQKAQELCQILPPKAWYWQVHNIWAFVKNDIRYTHDIYGVETIYEPQQILAQRYGDCDDKAVLLSALLMAAGHPCRFIAVGFKPGSFSHVYVATRIGPRWIGLETTEDVEMGWEPPGVVSKLVLNV